MKKTVLMALLGGCAIALAAQGAWAFLDPNQVPSGHGGVLRASTGSTSTSSQMGDVLSFLNKSGYSVQGLTLQSDGSYNAQVVGPDGAKKEVKVPQGLKTVLDQQGQPLPALMSADNAIAWVKQMGYTPQSFQVKDGKYVFAANDKSGQAENVTIDPVTKNLSVVAAG